MPTVLLVEDDPRITEPFERALQMHQFDVLVAHNGRDGLDLAREHKPDIVILDVMMPELSGWDVCQQLRQESTVPILMLTALGEEVDRILGLELGADDYLTKPVSARELVARIRAMLRRVQLSRQDPITEETPSEYRVGEIVLSDVRREVLKNGETLQLRYKEFELLKLLMHNAGTVVTRETLFNEVWGTEWYGDTRTLDVHIRWLRQKIEDDPSSPRYIRTIRGVGFEFVGEDRS